MPAYELHNVIDARVAFDSAAVTAGVDGIIIDTYMFESVEFVVIAGVITDGSYPITLQDGDDPALSDAATVAPEFVRDADGSGSLTFADTDDNTVKRFGYTGKKQYVRLRFDPVGASTGGVFVAAAILGHPHHAPVGG